MVHATRIGVVGIDSKNVALDPIRQEPHFLVGRTRLPGRRHDAGTHVLEHRPPEIRLPSSTPPDAKPSKATPPFFIPSPWQR